MEFKKSGKTEKKTFRQFIKRESVIANMKVLSGAFSGINESQLKMFKLT